MYLDGLQQRYTGLCCCVLFCCLVWFFSPPKPTNKKRCLKKRMCWESIQERDVLAKVAVLSWRNFCCCAGRGEVVTSFFMCLVLSCHLFVPPFHCSVIQAFSERVRMTHFENAGCYYCGIEAVLALGRAFFLREV